MELIARKVVFGDFRAAAAAFRQGIYLVATGRYAYIRAYILESAFQRLAVAAQSRSERISCPKVHYTDLVREREKGLAGAERGSQDPDIAAVFGKPGGLDADHPFHTPGIVQGMYEIDYLHFSKRDSDGKCFEKASSSW